MGNFSIDIVWAKIQMAVAAIGGWLGYFLGGMDRLMIALIVFMALDYIMGLMCAVIDKKMSSAVICFYDLHFRRDFACAHCGALSAFAG